MCSYSASPISNRFLLANVGCATTHFLHTLFSTYFVLFQTRNLRSRGYDGHPVTTCLKSRHTGTGWRRDSDKTSILSRHRLIHLFRHVQKGKKTVSPYHLEAFRHIVRVYVSSLPFTYIHLLTLHYLPFPHYTIFYLLASSNQSNRCHIRILYTPSRIYPTTRRHVNI